MTQSLGVPRVYVRMLCELEDFLSKTLAGWTRSHRMYVHAPRAHKLNRRLRRSACWLKLCVCLGMTADKPKLSPTNTRALTRMKQTLRKHNPSFAEEMQAFRCPPLCVYVVFASVFMRRMSNSWCYPAGTIQSLKARNQPLPNRTVNLAVRCFC